MNEWSRMIEWMNEIKWINKVPLKNTCLKYVWKQPEIFEFHESHGVHDKSFCNAGTIRTKDII